MTHPASTRVRTPDRERRWIANHRYGIHDGATTQRHVALLIDRLDLQTDHTIVGLSRPARHMAPAELTDLSTRPVSSSTSSSAATTPDPSNPGDSRHLVTAHRPDPGRHSLGAGAPAAPEAELGSAAPCGRAQPVSQKEAAHVRRTGSP
ncbi:hypothetical protein SAZ11_07450 [Streptomyces sp. FXJ1.4098]|nr:hypothetical protein [Streptomyces sp. FXJ1.4098]